MILVDSSVWIDFFSPLPARAGKELRRMIADAEPFAIAGVIVAEILQGLTRDFSQVERYLEMWDILEPRGFSTYREAAAIFRLARSKGISLSHHRHADCRYRHGTRYRRFHPRQGLLPHRPPHRPSAVSAPKPIESNAP